MEILKCLLLLELLTVLALTVAMVHARDDQSGFISIDCGITEVSNYTDSTTGILYSSDADFVNVGLNGNVSPEYKTNSSIDNQFLTLRSFPQGTRNCYNLRPTKGRNNRYLIRARFLYGNYDMQNQLPKFDVHLGVEYWLTVILEKESTFRSYEIIHIPTSDYINICFINTGHGTPFVSVLELRSLDDTIYKTESGSLDYFRRWDFGSTTNDYVRYEDDSYDRIWMPFDPPNTTTLRTLSDVDYKEYYKLPSKVMNTAITPQNAGESLTFSWEPDNTTTDEFYIYMHFAEIEALEPNQSRAFNIYLNGHLWHIPFSLPNTISSSSPDSCSSNLICEVRITRTENSTLPPIINAFEVYKLRKFEDPETDEHDLEAITNIKSTYNVTRNWQGDPCAPKDYVWDGVNCSYDSFNPPRIISLNLSSSGLTGEIAVDMHHLYDLQSLDLSNNSLTGQVPDFLTHLPSLSVLKLNGNNFSGSIPAELLEKSMKGLLSLSIDGLGNNTKKSNSKPIVVLIAASVAAVSLGLLAAGLIFLWLVKKRKQQGGESNDDELNKREGALETKNRQFTYSEVLSITNNFEKVIGKGGFGTVYHGYVGDTQVAVKMLSSSSTQGYKEFQAEATLLMSVHHRNLSTLVGYCNEGNNMGIIYEYMANGNLDKHLSDRNIYVLSWEERLQIATDAANGLEYLHHGCKPAIVHRDVKSSNILLNEKFQAKLTDFGLSRAFLVEGDSHVSTVVAGTPGYLDPEYYSTNRLTEKSDVYGFGIVLLEIITGRPSIAKTRDRTHLVQWVTSMLQNGDISNIVDPRLKGDFEINSAWKAVELAMACATRVSSKRPTMDAVVMELKECLATVVMTLRDNVEVSKDSIGSMSLNIDSGLDPRAR